MAKKKPAKDDVVLKPHQEYAVAELKKAFHAVCDGGPNPVCLVLPTGMGKTAVMRAFARWVIENGGLGGGRVSVFTNRRILVDQISKGLSDVGMGHALRCAGHPWDHDDPLQVTSTQTDYARVTGAAGWEVAPADVVFYDEAHMQKGKMARQSVRHYVAAGALVVGLTATPVGLGGIYTKLILAGNNTEGRKSKLLVGAKHYGPDEPDLRHVKDVRVGVDLTEEQNRKAMGAVGDDGKPDVKLKSLCGRVVEWYHRLNPRQTPTILFAPGVKESVWFAEQFTDRGIPAAHIDGDEIWDSTVPGNRCHSTTENRDAVFERLRAGRIKVLCNRFVLREGGDWPWVEHLIMGCVFGSLQSYLQSGGRGLRASPATGKTGLVVQDHGGNWWRHGSLNADRTWDLNWTETQIGHLSLTKFTDPNSDEPKPFLCPYCSQVMSWQSKGDRFMVKCQGCGADIDFTRRSRPVLQADGGLGLHGGDPLVPHETRVENDTARLWISIYWRAKKANMTFKAALGLFKRDHGYYPSEALPYMPVHATDLARKVADVPFERLFPDPEYEKRRQARLAREAAAQCLADPDVPE